MTRSPMYQHEELKVSCSVCGAGVGQFCRDPGVVVATELGTDGMSVHSVRWDDAKEYAADLRAERAADYADDGRFE